MPCSVKVGARSSPLARAQVEEVFKELVYHHSTVTFSPRFLATKGDLDRATSLRDLPKDDFFTREIDELLMAQEIDVAIHSAKDLPATLLSGLKVVALTKGVDPRDVLVLREGATLAHVKRVATSSVRREEAVLALKGDVEFCDIRGTIGERLMRLEEDVDGVVIAEAALIRLGLTHLNRLYLPGETAPLQGRLAVVAREGDREMERLFQCLEYCM